MKSYKSIKAGKSSKQDAWSKINCLVVHASVTDGQPSNMHWWNIKLLLCVLTFNPSLSQSGQKFYIAHLRWGGGTSQESSKFSIGACGPCHLCTRNVGKERGWEQESSYLPQYTFPGPKTGDIRNWSGEHRLPSVVSPSWFIPRLCPISCAITNTDSKLFPSLIVQE